MSLWPVLVREVRQVSRQPATYRARWIAALAVLGAGGLSGLEAGRFRPGEGGEVFAWLHIAVFASTWVLVPVMTADCLSRERREATLGLLFLTPLRALDIVLAKLFVHALRGVLLWLAAIPVFAVPFLIGGVSWQQALTAIFHNLSALMLGLAAGVLASAFSKTWSRAVIWALLLALALLVLWTDLLGLSTGWFVNMKWRAGMMYFVGEFDVEEAPLFGLRMATLWQRSVEEFRWTLNIPAAAVANRLLILASLFSGFSLVGLLLACVVAARVIRRSWREEPPSALRLEVQRRFTTPVLGRNLLKRWLKRTLRRNPVGWLERRTWSGRLILFGWLAIVIGVFSGLAQQIDFWILNMRRFDIDLINLLLAQPILLSVAGAAAGSFRRERETGVLELLLVSPLKASAIVLGRIRGLYAQFLPSVILIFYGWVFLLSAIPDGRPDRFLVVIRFVAWSFAIPCIGLYLSLCTRSFVAAFLFTVLIGWGVPWLAAGFGKVVYWMLSPHDHNHVPTSWGVLPALVSLLLAAVAVRLLVRRLEQRRFAFNREVT